jgi:SAM-dependent methyltransferase
VLRFDADAARRIEQAYTTPGIVRQRAVVLAALDLRAGESALDVGAGPGFLAQQMAVQVEPAGRVCGIDISDDMLAIAAQRVTEPGSAPLELVNGGVETIPYGDATFDAVVATQVLEYVVDLPHALREMHRVLRPAGRVVIVDTDWDSLVWQAPDPAVMARVLAAWGEHLADPHLPRTLCRQLRRAGFVVEPPTVLPLLDMADPHESFSGLLLGLVARFVVGRHGLTAADVDGWERSMRALGEDWFFSLNRYVFRATRPASPGRARRRC